MYLLILSIAFLTIFYKIDLIVELRLQHSSTNELVSSTSKKLYLFLIRIGKGLKLSLPFPLVHTVRATFTAYGVPTNRNHSMFLCICKI
ncbi:hypothetical protein E2636_07530 [Paenisporosarcina antarctica]|uniref:Uncharacterized protein n=1 Tax=Paenisporosarcina antarctica TaxID=417367 RepID=A0A4V1AMZ4_9BACL|nr:hypothetical protein E2636_07530 [Paenisporosarcina antarctica]